MARVSAWVAVGVVTLAAAVLAFLWLRPQDTAPEGHALDIVQGACSKMPGIDQYDLSAIAKGSKDGVPWSGDLVIKASVSGKDYQAIFSSTGSDVVDESIRVGEVGYERSSAVNNEWKVSRGPKRDVDSYITADLGDTPICPELSRVANKGEEEVNGVKTTKYASGEDTSAADFDKVQSDFAGMQEISAHEYWVDANGLLVRHRQEHFTLTQFEGIGREVSHVVMITDFSDVGETNAITAPVLGE